MKSDKLKSMKPRIFKFEKGQNWDGDEQILDYIEGVLLGYGEVGSFPTVKQKTYITVMVAKVEDQNTTNKVGDRK